ncbi:hypothetical protein ACFOEY_01190 [Paracandidimonas soli]|uniref:hypothetical protein n=1 Tax=Paracandidimonas soli TaxID=1917182 RepID=UPI00361D86F9
MPPYPRAEPSSSSAWFIPLILVVQCQLALCHIRRALPVVPTWHDMLAPFSITPQEESIPAHRVVVPCNSSAWSSYRKRGGCLIRGHR